MQTQITQIQSYPNQVRKTDKYVDIEIVTTRVDYIDALFQQLLDRTNKNQAVIPDTADGVSLALLDIHNENKTTTCECVELIDGHFRVVLDVATIDEAATMKALQRVATAIDEGVSYYEFSEPKTLWLGEFSWLLIKH